MFVFCKYYVLGQALRALFLKSLGHFISLLVSWMLLLLIKVMFFFIYLLLFIYIFVVLLMFAFFLIEPLANVQLNRVARSTIFLD